MMRRHPVDDSILTDMPELRAPRPSTTPSSRRALRRSAVSTRLLLLVADVVLVLIFAAAGNRTHESGLAALDVLTTASPFLLALIIVSATLWPLARPSRLWPDGLLVLVTTVAGGMALRVLLGLGGAPASFIMVTTVVLTVLLLGRRLLSGLLRPATRG